MDATNIAEPVGIPDASMMDPTIDDLFGEAAGGLAVPMPPAPLPTPVVLRIAEMQSYHFIFERLVFDC